MNELKIIHENGVELEHEDVSVPYDPVIKLPKLYQMPLFSNMNNTHTINMNLQK